MRTIVTDTFKLSVFPPYEDGLLFSRIEDPHESRNLWNEPGFSKIKAELLQQLLYQCVCTDSLTSSGCAVHEV